MRISAPRALYESSNSVLLAADSADVKIPIRSKLSLALSSEFVKAFPTTPVAPSTRIFLVGSAAILTQTVGI